MRDTHDRISLWNNYPWSPKVAELTPPPTGGLPQKIVKFPFGLCKESLKASPHSVTAGCTQAELLYLRPDLCRPIRVSLSVHGFVRSGNVDPTVAAGTFRNAGINGYDWSSRGSSTHANGSAIPSAYNLNFNATTAYPSNGPNERYIGLPLRCLDFATVRCRSF